MSIKVPPPRSDTHSVGTCDACWQRPATKGVWPRDTDYGGHEYKILWLCEACLREREK